MKACSCSSHMKQEATEDIEKRDFLYQTICLNKEKNTSISKLELQVTIYYL